MSFRSRSTRRIKEGREKRADYGDGIYVEYSYEGSGTDWTTLDAPTIGHIERRFTDDGNLGGWLTPGGGEIIFTYNDNGQLETETDPSGQVTRYTYDAVGRVKTVTDEATGLVTEHHYDSLPEGIADPDPNIAD
ncbi:MAG: RHS repeat protein, partial [Okeania sp. SIO2H7]|nr:RHS repeat protein [Okeania sp. SIO2H7]